MKAKVAWIIKSLDHGDTSLVYNKPYDFINTSGYEVIKIVYFEIDED